MNVLSREKQEEIAACLAKGISARETAEHLGVNKDTVGRYRKAAMADGVTLPPPRRGGPRRKALKPSKRGKRGRVLRTIETGREISHEEVLRALAKRTAVLVTNGVPCPDCGTPVERPKGGRRPRCLMCRAKVRQAHLLRDAEKRGQRAGSRGPYKSPSALLAAATRRAEGKTTYTRKMREDRAAKGLCVFCGKAPGWNGTRRCESCREKRRQAKGPR
jgi:hypothetical protein